MIWRVWGRPLRPLCWLRACQSVCFFCYRQTDTSDPRPLSLHSRDIPQRAPSRGSAAAGRQFQIPASSFPPAQGLLGGAGSPPPHHAAPSVHSAPLPTPTPPWPRQTHHWQLERGGWRGINAGGHRLNCPTSNKPGVPDPRPAPGRAGFWS